VLYNSAAAKECVEVFLTHSIRPLTMVIQISGHNRARQRDKWARLLEEFAVLQDEVLYCSQQNIFSIVPLIFDLGPFVFVPVNNFPYCKRYILVEGWIFFRKFGLAC